MKWIRGTTIFKLIISFIIIQNLLTTFGMTKIPSAGIAIVSFGIFKAKTFFIMRVFFIFISKDLFACVEIRFEEIFFAW
jgi:hypothetical protein